MGGPLIVQNSHGEGVLDNWILKPVKIRPSAANIITIHNTGENVAL